VYALSAATVCLSAVPAVCQTLDLSKAPKDGPTRFVVLIAGFEGKTYQYAEYSIPFHGTFGAKELLEEEESKEGDKMAKLVLRRREKNNEAGDTAKLEKISASLKANNLDALQTAVNAIDKLSDEYEPPVDYYDVRSANGEDILTVFSPVPVRANRQLTCAATQAGGRPVLIDLTTLGVTYLPSTKSADKMNFRFRWSPDGSLLAYKMSRDTVGIFDLAKKELLRTINCGGSVDDMRWDAAGGSVVIAVLKSAPSFKKVTDIIRTAKDQEPESRHVCLVVVDAGTGAAQELLVRKYVRHAHVLVEWVK
jgi:hypothetical protein